MLYGKRRDDMPLIENPKIDENTEAYKLAQKFYYEEVKYDYIPNGILAHMVVPEIGKAALNLMFAVLKHESRVSAELKMLIANMTSYAVGCTYCQTNTYEATLNMSEDNEKLQRIWDYQNDPLFSEAERAALDLALAASSSPNAVTDELRENLKKHFGQAECAEIMATISVFSYFQKWNDTNGTTLEPHVINVAENELLGKGHLDENKFATLKGN